MAQVGALRTTISLDSAQFQQSMSSVNRQLKGLQSEMKASTSSGTGFARGVDELRTKSDILTRTLNVQQTKVQELRRRYEESRKATGENSKETQNAQIAYNKAVAEMNQTENALKNVTKELQRQTNPWNVLSKNMDSTGRKFQEIGGKMTSFGRDMSMKVTAPIMGLGGLMLKTGMDFEAAMSNVQAISGATGDDLAKLQDKAREMGAATTKSASEAADGLSYMALAGWDTQEMLEGLEPILRLSEAASIDLGRASDLVTDSMSALQIKVQDLPKYLDNVAEASRSSNTSMDQLMQAYVVAGGNLAQFNVPLEESTAILGLLANRGLKGSEAGRALNAVMVNLTSGAGQAGKAMEDLEISAFDAQGNFIGLEETLRLVKDRTKDMTDEQRAQYISMIAGKEHLKSFQGLLAGLDDEYGSLKSNVAGADGALNDMAETMQNNARGNVARLKSAFEELSIQFAEHLIPMFTAGIEKVTGLVQKFSELDDDTKKNIITMAGFAAAIGPVALVVGNLTTAIGGVLRVGGSLAGLLGKVGGAGLLGRLAGLGVAGPVGLAIGGVGLLGTAIWALHDASKQNIEDTYNSILARKDEIDQMDELISQYEALQQKNKLTTDEILRYMDIMSELKSAKSEEAIAELTKEQEKLLEKSGMTNEEMQQFLDLNNAIIEKSPSTVEAISEQGNAYAGVLDELKELTAYERERLTQDTGKAITDELSKQEKNLEKQKQLQEEIKQAEADRNIEQQKVLDYNKRIMEIDLEIAQLQKEKINASSEELQSIKEREDVLISEKNILDGQVESTDAKIGKINNEIDKKQESLDKTEKELELFNDLIDEYAQMVLYEQGIVSEKGKAVEKLKEEQKQLDDNRKELEKMRKEGKLVGGAYQEQNEILNEQQRKIDTATKKLSDMNEVAGKTVYKDLNISTNPSINKLNQDLSSSLTKRINVDARINGAAAISAYATGTDYHPGGPFIAGEEGWELGRKGNQWEILNAGVYNRPPGYQVFPHEESVKIMRAINNMPAYADGARPLNEANRLINQMYNQEGPLTGEVVIYTTVINQMNGREISREIHKDITKFQKLDRKVRESFA